MIAVYLVPCDTGIIYGLRSIGDSEFRYVGLTRGSLPKRWQEHRYAAKYNKRHQPVYSWIRKHGAENIEIVPLEIVDLEILQSQEIYWIASLKKDGHRLLNATTGGDGGVGRVVSEETRSKISLVHKGKTLSAEVREKISQSKQGDVPWNKGKTGHLTDEQIHRHAESLRGRPVTAETRAKMSAAHRGNTNGKYTKGIPKKSGHTRYHTNKNVSKPETCKYCKEEIE